MRTLIILVLLVIVFGFDQQSNNLSSRMSNRYLLVDIDKSILSYTEQVYLPLYSPDYLQSHKEYVNYTARVHVVNKGSSEPVYLLCIDCYDSDGERCEKLINKTVKLNPLDSIAFYVNTDPVLQGNGANVIVDWGVRNRDIKPDIFIEMIVRLPNSQIKQIESGKTVSDQDEILDRRPL